jgi:hypothetical protein
MITKQIKQQWVDALNSGQYQQARNTLYVVAAYPAEQVTVTSYCCLGVLCVLQDIAMRDAAPEKRLTDTSTDPYWHIKQLVPDWATLARLNDSGQSFVQIAAYIEKNVQTED